MRKITVDEIYIKLAEDFIGGVILNYLVDFSKELNEEYSKTNLSFDEYIELDLQEISDKNMLGLSSSSIRRYINKFIKKGFINKNTNYFKYKYKINVEFIEEQINSADEKIEFDRYSQKSFFRNDEKKGNHLASDYQQIQNISKINNIYDTTNIIKSQDSLVEKIDIIIRDVLGCRSESIRINREFKDTVIVKEVFRQINNNIIQSVINKFKGQNSKIFNIKGYLTTTLYNTVIEQDFNTINKENKNTYTNYIKPRKNSFVNYTQPNYDFEKLQKIAFERLLKG